VAGPSWLAGAFAAVMIVIALYSASRLAASRWQRRETEFDADGVHVVMGVAMAGILVPRLSPLPASAWEAVFGIAAAWFAWQAIPSAAATPAHAGGAPIPCRTWSSASPCSTCSWRCPAPGPPARERECTWPAIMSWPAQPALADQMPGSGPDQARDGLRRFPDLVPGLRPALLNRLGDTVAAMILEQPQSDRLQRPRHRRNLGEDINAVHVLIHHPLQAAHLALDPAQPLQISVLLLRIPAHGPTLHRRRYRAAPPRPRNPTCLNHIRRRAALFLAVAAPLTASGPPAGDESA
jgi:hypothetical protein